MGFSCDQIDSRHRPFVARIQQFTVGAPLRDSSDLRKLFSSLARNIFNRGSYEHSEAAVSTCVLVGEPVQDREAPLLRGRSLSHTGRQTGDMGLGASYGPHGADA